MSVEARPSAPTWAGLPLLGVVRVAGVDRAALAVGLDAPDDDAPVVIGCDVEPSDSAVRIVADVLDQLTTVAIRLFPAWLPGGEHVDGISGLERRTVRGLARTLAASTSHYGPFVEAVADDALSGTTSSAAFPAETRATGLVGILTASYQQASIVLLLTARMPAQDVGVAAAAAWLADHGHVGVWLVGPELAGVDRFPSVMPHLPDYVARMTRTTARDEPPRPDHPAVAGRPHPLSTAEQLLESRLAALDWAAGRVWNQLHRGSALDPPIRVDLMWPDARCAVELDGPDHRGALKYADDRRRDNTLVLDGYAVLRFTNHEVHDDVTRVLATIERLLTSRRLQKGDTA